MSSSVNRAIRALPPVRDMVRRLSLISRENANAELRAYRSCTLDPEYFDEVERELNTVWMRREEEDREKDLFYKKNLSPADRQRADKIVTDLMPDLAYAYKEVQKHIDVSRTGTHDRVFWMYIRRELNKSRLSGKVTEKDGGA